MSIVIDGALYMDNLYKKYIVFRRNLSINGTMLFNPISNALDYIFYAISHMEILLKKYTFRVVYFNVNHRMRLLNKSAKNIKYNDGKLARSFKDMICLMDDGDLLGIYTDYHNYFRRNVKTYKLTDLTDRRIGYDYDNNLPDKQLSFIRDLLIEQNNLTADDIYHCNLYILSMLRNCRIVYTENSNIDYLKYHKARFIRKMNWKQYKRIESIVKKPSIADIYTYFSTSRKLPLIDCCQTNSYDMFILTDNPFDMYVFNKASVFYDENLLDDYIDVIDIISKNKDTLDGINCNDDNDNDETHNDMVVNDVTVSSYNTVQSIEPTEITFNDVNILINHLTQKWNGMYEMFDLTVLSLQQTV